jgi:hypothetical protein
MDWYINIYIYIYIYIIADRVFSFILKSKVRSRAQKLEIEMDSIEEGILELISRHQIKRLVMGAAAEKRHQRYKQHKNFFHMIIMHVH